ncbi:MAG: class I SAM-dependent methyltransferase [Planctomycetota bacterium]
MVDLQQVNTSYEPFSLEPEYVEENRTFLQNRDFSGVTRILDLACGNGGSTAMLVGAAPHVHLNGVDIDEVGIQLSEKRFRELGYDVRRGFEITDDMAGDKPVLVFGVSSADELPFPEATFDYVTIANAIHMLPDKTRFVEAATRVLKPGGWFGFNSCFYAGTFPGDTDRFYTDWLKLAAQALTDRSRELVAAGKPPLKRKRKTSHRAFENRWLSQQEWLDLVVEHGLEPSDVVERNVMLDERCFVAISAYGGFASVLLSGYPVEDASWALQSTVAPALEAYGAQRIPRNWLQVWARKTGGP